MLAVFRLMLVDGGVLKEYAAIAEEVKRKSYHGRNHQAIIPPIAWKKACSGVYT
jgi:hypothetical protein